MDATGSSPATEPGQAAQPTLGSIRVGIGGWIFDGWRGSFYPSDLPRGRELAHASERLTAIEINSTYYSTQRPATFAKWRDSTPPGFVFSVKASRFTTNRRVLAEAGESIAHFVGSGIAELGPKLGPIVWQFAPTKRFDPDDFAAFIDLLPTQVDGVPLRHALDVRHESFMDPAYLGLARSRRIATVFTDSPDHPSFADLTGDFVYARLMRTTAAEADGCPSQIFAPLAACAECWAAGGEPGGLPRIEPRPSIDVAATTPRDVFLYFISGAKEKAPAAALALLRQLS